MHSLQAYIHANRQAFVGMYVCVCACTASWRKQNKVKILSIAAADNILKNNLSIRLFSCVFLNPYASATLGFVFSIEKHVHVRRIFEILSSW